MKVEQKYVVGKKIFDSAEEAEKYIEEHADQVRIDAFVEHLRKMGKQRVTSIITETVAEFIKFEKGDFDYTQTEETNTESVKESSDSEEPPFQSDSTSEAEVKKEPKPSIFDDSDAAAEDNSNEEVQSPPVNGSHTGTSLFAQ